MKTIATLLLSGFCLAVLASSAPAQAVYPYGRIPAAPPPWAPGTPPPPPASYVEPYVFAHLGVFDPNSDWDGLRRYDVGMHFDVGLGSRLSPFLAVDGTVGGYGAKAGADKATVIPVTVGVRLIIPHPFLEPYVGGGVGIYFSRLEEAPQQDYSGIDDQSTDLGGYISCGADFWLNSRVALNLEGRYDFVTPTFQSAAGNSFDVNMGGLTGSLGVRFAF